MKGKISFIFVSSMIWLTSCTSNQDEEESTMFSMFSNKEAESRLIKELFIEMNKSEFDSIGRDADMDVSPIIRKYFYKPDEIIENMTAEHFILYRYTLNFYSFYLKEEGDSVKFYWNGEILNQGDLSWILDENQCEETLLITYIDKDGRLRDFCACFKEGSIFSILPYGNGKGGVIWTRKLKSKEVEEGIMLVPDGASDSVASDGAASE